MFDMLLPEPVHAFLVCFSRQMFTSNASAERSIPFGLDQVSLGETIAWDGWADSRDKDGFVKETLYELDNKNS
jgi:hypothetical protein